MKNISNLSRHYEEGYGQSIIMTKSNYLRKKVCAVAKKTLDFLCKHQTVLALVGFSYLLIEVGTMASEVAFGEKYVVDLDSCRSLLCSELNNLHSFAKIPEHIESHCHPNLPKDNSLSFFKECLNDLCEYMNIIGKKFYACTDIVSESLSEIQNTATVDSVESIEEQSNFTLELWNKLCPKKKFRKKDTLKELAYLNKCIKRVCRHSSISKITVDKTIMNWCNTASINKLYKLLKKLMKILDESQKKNPDKWTQANIIGTLVTAVGGIVVGVTSVVGTIVTCKAARAASSMARTIPSLTSGLQSIVTGTTETTRAILEASRSGAAEVIPMETINILSQISDTLSHSLSYYSAEDIPLQSGLSNIEIGNVGPKSIDTPVQSPLENIAPIGDVAVGAVIDSVGSAVGSVGSVINGAEGTVTGGAATKLLSVAGSFLRSIGISTISKTGDGTLSGTVEQTSTADTIEQIEKMKEEYLNDLIVRRSEIHNIVKVQALRLKNSLLAWNNSFCFFDFPNLACRLPAPPHLMEQMILVPLENLRKILSENVAGLCYSIWGDLWCNWSRFFDVLSIERNETQDNNSCPWDQFLLSIQESSNNVYQIGSSLRGNGCYNETVLIKV